jgi:hypothetical protein
LPVLRTTLTAAWYRRRLPGFGFCEMTRPFLTLREAACLTLPSLQLWLLSERLAAFSVLPSSFGTTHFLSEKEAVTARLALIVTRQAPVPVHAPDQPANLEFEAGVGVNVTDVPCL